MAEDSITGGSTTPFNFIDWSKEYKLKKATTDALAKEDLNNKEVLLLADPVVINSCAITMGQKILLSKALAELGNPHYKRAEPACLPGSGAQATASRGPGSIFAPASPAKSTSSVLRELDAEVDQIKTSSKEQMFAEGSSLEFLTKKRDMYDVLTILGCGVQNKANVVFPYDTLTTAQKAVVDRRKKEKNVFEKDAEGKLVMKPDVTNVHPLSMAEWGFGAAKVGLQLLQEGTLNIEEYVRYNAYVATVWLMAQKNEWASVREFDSTYRENQARFNFPWGESNRYMEDHCLVKFQDRTSTKSRGNKQGPSYNSLSSQRSNNGRGLYCHAFAASGHCNYGQSCRYPHIAGPISAMENSEAKNEFAPKENQTRPNQSV